MDAYVWDLFGNIFEILGPTEKMLVKKTWHTLLTNLRKIQPTQEKEMITNVLWLAKSIAPKEIQTCIQGWLNRCPKQKQPSLFTMLSSQQKATALRTPPEEMTIQCHKQSQSRDDCYCQPLGISSAWGRATTAKHVQIWR